MTAHHANAGTAPLQLLRDGGCLREGVARRPWMAGGMGTDDARTTTTDQVPHQPQRVVETCGRSITNSETPQLAGGVCAPPRPRGSQLRVIAAAMTMTERPGDQARLIIAVLVAPGMRLSLTHDPRLSGAC
jgi:hypothetical protein